MVEGRLEAEDYLQRLGEADVLLLAYDPEVYDMRSSGILIEGLSVGAIIITREGAAMEDAAKEQRYRRAPYCTVCR